MNSQLTTANEKIELLERLLDEANEQIQELNDEVAQLRPELQKREAECARWYERYAAN